MTDNFSAEELQELDELGEKMARGDYQCHRCKRTSADWAPVALQTIVYDPQDHPVVKLCPECALDMARWGGWIDIYFPNGEPTP